MKNTLKIVSYLIISLIVGIAATLLTDKIEDITVERNIRKALETSIMHSLSSFRESTAHISSAEEEAFIRKFIENVLKDKVTVSEHSSAAVKEEQDRLFLFTLKDNSLDLDFYIQEAYLKSELSTLDVVDYISGLTATIITFASIVLYTENKRKTLSMQQQFETKHAELSSAMKQHEALALLGRMSAALAHELKTPIATISNLVQTFPARREDPQFVNRFLALTREELNRTQQLIDNLLAYGKEIDIRNNDWVPIELVLKKNNANGPHIDLEKPFTLFGDRFYLDLLFQNLLRNSREAGADTVKVRLKMPDQDVRSSIRIVLEDNGSGFAPADDLEALTEPFVTSRSRGGGLGLYLAKKITTAHGGMLSLERMERGARVILSIPTNRVRALT